jgi:hypothetical protein
MNSLGDDLVLLSIVPGSGRIYRWENLSYALMGAELAMLAAAGRVDIVQARVVVLDPAPTGDAELDAALASVAGRDKPPRARAWVSRRRPGIRQAYLARLTAAGAISGERHLTGTRWRVQDAARAADARARLDAVVLSSGSVDTSQGAYGGLAHAAGLGSLIYKGWANRAARKRLAQLAKGGWPATASTADSTDAMQAAVRAAVAAAAAASASAASAAAG